MLKMALPGAKKEQLFLGFNFSKKFRIRPISDTQTSSKLSRLNNREIFYSIQSLF